MEVNKEWLKEFTSCFKDAKVLSEGGYNFIYIKELSLPEGCNPTLVEALLCIHPRDGYDSRLFLSEKLTGCPNRNWNGTAHILDRNWFAISWKTAPGLTYLQMLMVHLKAFKND